MAIRHEDTLLPGNRNILADILSVRVNTRNSAENIKEITKALKDSNEAYTLMLNLLGKISSVKSEILETEKRTAAEKRLLNKLTTEDLKNALQFIEKKREMLRLEYQQTDKLEEQAKLRQELEKSYTAELELKYRDDWKGGLQYKANAQEEHDKRALEISNMETERNGQMGVWVERELRDEQGNVILDDKGNAKTTFVDMTSSLVADNDAKLDAAKKFGVGKSDSGLGNKITNAITSSKVGNKASEILGKFGNKLTSKMGFIGVLIKIVQAIGKTVDNLYLNLSKNVDDITNVLTSENAKKLDSRLYGLMSGQEGMNTNIALFAKDVNKLYYDSPFVDMKSLIDNITILGNQGIAYNLELRALWATLSDKIVSTFEVTNETLKQLVVLQQLELTDTYMGVEAALTRTFNSMFLDTQYLSSTYDAVWGNILLALATVSPDEGTQIAYQILKWLGALSSVGMSSSAAGSIATAMGQLLTGDTSSLSDQGRTLLAMSASKAGISYSDLLINGAQSGDEINNLLRSMIEVLKSIYETSADNNVVLSQWGDVFGLEMADWRAISNLSLGQMKTLSGLTMDQEAAMKETEYITENLIQERTTIAERIRNFENNVWTSLGIEIAGDLKKYADFYTNRKINSVLRDLGFGNTTAGKIINGIVEVSALFDAENGSGASVTDLLKTLDARNFWDTTGGLWNTTQFIGNNDTLSDYFSYRLLGGEYVDYNNITQGITGAMASNAPSVYGGNSSRSSRLRNMIENQLSIQQVGNPVTVQPIAIQNSNDESLLLQNLINDNVAEATGILLKINEKLPDISKQDQYEFADAYWNNMSGYGTDQLTTLTYVNQINLARNNV